MNTFCHDAVTQQVLGDTVGSVLRSSKYECLLQNAARQQLHEKTCLMRLPNRIHGLGNAQRRR
jgi:hypothetical protein